MVALTPDHDREYDELEIRLEREGDGYTVLASAADGRKGRGRFSTPISDEALDEFVDRVGLVRRARSGRAERIERVKKLGSSLFDALVQDEIAAVYQSARATADGNGRGLRVTLYLSGAPELMRLPWEYLYKRPKFLCHSARTPVVRSLDLDAPSRPRKVDFPLRVLGVVSSPAGYEELDSDAERGKLEEALGGLIDDGFVELHWLERATLSELGQRVAEPDDIHVLHFIGHGAYNEVNESGTVVLETRHGRADDVTGEELGVVLQDEESLRLVVLNSCQGARISRFDPFSGAATSLIEFGIPAVIGMQFEITDKAAIVFSQSLYSGLANGLPIDAAIGPARRAILNAECGAEFGTPVLFMRAGGARLFDLHEATLPEPVEPECDFSVELAVSDDEAWKLVVRNTGQCELRDVVARNESRVVTRAESLAPGRRLIARWTGAGPQLITVTASDPLGSTLSHEVASAAPPPPPPGPDPRIALAQRLVDALASRRAALERATKARPPRPAAAAPAAAIWRPPAPSGEQSRYKPESAFNPEFPFLGEPSPSQTGQRARIRTLEFGKPLSRDALANELERTEDWLFITTCVPPDSSFFRNGMLMVTSRRLVWVREGFGMPKVSSIDWSDVTAVIPGSTKPLRNVLLKTLSGAFTFGELLPGEAELVERNKDGPWAPLMPSPAAASDRGVETGGARQPASPGWRADARGGPGAAMPGERARVALIRSWVREGRTDPWIAHQLEISASDLRAIKVTYRID